MVTLSFSQWGCRREQTKYRAGLFYLWTYLGRVIEPASEQTLRQLWRFTQPGAAQDYKRAAENAWRAGLHLVWMKPEAGIAPTVDKPCAPGQRSHVCLV
ncbi:hypothetical protein ABH944_006365 [Caballeronia udeis]|uniref:Uncharacterized protein n=1 Tax=Caballeronia udeis TaxID=1232866 RepID=A0ABW8MRD3_9BURK